MFLLAIPNSLKKRCTAGPSLHSLHSQPDSLHSWNNLIDPFTWAGDALVSSLLLYALPHSCSFVPDIYVHSWRAACILSTLFSAGAACHIWSFFFLFFLVYGFIGRMPFLHCSMCVKIGSRRWGTPNCF